MDKYAKPFNVKSVPTTTVKYFKVLTISYYAAAAQLILFGIVALVLVIAGFNLGRPRGGGADSTGPMPQNVAFVLYIVVLLLTLGAIFGGNMLFNKKINSIRNISNLLEKLKAYGLSVARRSRFLETAGLTSIVVFLVTKQFIVLISPVLAVGLLLYWRPTKERLINDLQLSSDETNIINDPDGIIG